MEEIRHEHSSDLLYRAWSSSGGETLEEIFRKRDDLPGMDQEERGTDCRNQSRSKNSRAASKIRECFLWNEVFGKEYTDKKEAAKALLKAGMAFTNSNSEQIGAYRGFELHRSYNIASDEIQLEIQGQICYTFPFSKTDWVNLSKLDTVLDKLPEVLKEEQQKLDMLHQQMGNTQKQLSQPFPQEEALREKTKRLEELTAELDMDSSTKTNSAEEIIKTGYQKQTENTPLKQLRCSHLRQKRAEIKAGMEY